MIGLLRTNDPVLISWVLSYLGDAGIKAIVFDANVSIVEGSIGAIPRRVVVIDDDAARARHLLREAEIDHVD